MKSIYLVFSHSNTLTSKMIKYFSKEKYSHVSISLDDKCDNMFSFGRKYTHFAIIGCFNVENIHRGLYKIHKDSTMAIYKLNVTNEQYDRIIERIRNIKINSKGYNIIGLLLANFRIRLNRNKYYCSEFVYNVLSSDGVNIIGKDKGVFKPMELSTINGLELMYEGKVCDYSNGGIYGNT